MASREQQLAELLVGGFPVSPLLTDGYKFSMAQAGNPLVRETFYLSCRQGGPFYVPLDLGAVLQAIVQNLRPATPGEVEFLDFHGYGMTPEMQEALRGGITVWSPPATSWVGDREPLATVTGPSFLVSWLEPLAIRLHWVVQVATAILKGQSDFICTCETEAKMISMLREIIQPTRSMTLRCKTDGYRRSVVERAWKIMRALRNEMRAFEVGMRAATCEEMHELALVQCKENGIEATSNVALAFKLGMVPIGTTGHEHQQRHLTDLAGFRAIRDKRKAPPSYLFDTFDALKSGIPAALQAMKEKPRRPVALRFDSGDQEEQFRIIKEGCAAIHRQPILIFEDGYTAERTKHNEDFCNEQKWPRNLRRYGYGGYLVCAADWIPFTRNSVSAVYKLSATNGIPVMKSCGDKSSIPGVPIILRSPEGESIVAQVGEDVRRFGEIEPGSYPKVLTGVSDRTKDIIRGCKARQEQSRDNIRGQEAPQEVTL